MTSAVLRTYVRRLTIALLAVGLLYGVHGGPRSVLPVGAEQTETQFVTLLAGEGQRFYYAPDQLELKPGPVHVHLVNEGLRSHTFNIKDANWRDVFNSTTVSPGAEIDFDFELLEPGSYTFYCILYKHVDFGQTGQLTIVP